MIKQCCLLHFPEQLNIKQPTSLCPSHAWLFLCFKKYPSVWCSFQTWSLVHGPSRTSSYFRQYKVLQGILVVLFGVPSLWAAALWAPFFVSCLMFPSSLQLILFKVGNVWDSLLHYYCCSLVGVVVCSSLVSFGSKYTQSIISFECHLQGWWQGDTITVVELVGITNSSFGNSLCCGYRQVTWLMTFPHEGGKLSWRMLKWRTK